jgi:adenosylcobinamide amidohydrolase
VNPDAPSSLLTLRDHAMILDLGGPRAVISSAPYRGGLVFSRFLLNTTVPSDFVALDLPSSLRVRLKALDLPLEQTTVCLTAVDVTKVQQGWASAGGLACTAFVTAGLGNLSAPGLTPIAPAYAGTINIFAVLQANLPPAALVEAVQMVTEVKARALSGRTTPHGDPATGTSTDTVTIALLDGPDSQYCGAVTAAGYVLARAVDLALERALEFL